MTFAWHPEAIDEAGEAADWHGAIDRSLGDRFEAALEATVRRALRDPEVPRDLGDGCRRYFVRRFPYAVIYRPEGERLMVYAVMHLHRCPDYWKERVEAPSP